jgi:hypothetical protein
MQFWQLSADLQGEALGLVMASLGLNGPPPDTSRFAVKYHQIYGETLTSTLRRTSSPSSRPVPSAYALA